MSYLSNKITFSVNPITEIGECTIWVQFRDKITCELLHRKEVKRAFLAKAYHEHRVVKAINGVPVIDI